MAGRDCAGTLPARDSALRPLLDQMQAVNLINLFRAEHRSLVCKRGGRQKTMKMLFSRRRWRGSHRERGLQNQKLGGNHGVLYKIRRERTGEPDFSG